MYKNMFFSWPLDSNSQPLNTSLLPLARDTALIKAHSDKLHFLHAARADRRGVEKYNFFYFLWQPL